MFNNNQCFNRININAVLSRRPDAKSEIMGSCEYSSISGLVRFYQLRQGVVVVTEVNGLPDTNEVCMSPVFGCHIHSGCCCTGNSADAFADAEAHYNPDCCEHPYHAGDMPPLFGNHGYAFSIFLTDRFCVEELLGRTVIVHLHPDDFHSQPAGNSGMKIACGVIERF